MSKIEMEKSAIYTKALPWKYEEEWRLISSIKGPAVRVVEPQLLTGVILGARISANDKEAVTEWVRCHITPVELYQASLARHAFEIDVVSRASNAKLI